MNDLGKVVDRVTSAMHDLRIIPPKLPQDTSLAARAIGARLRSRRRRLVVGTAVGVLMLTVTGIGVTASGLLSASSIGQPDKAAYLPRDQPQCPGKLPTSTSTGRLLIGTTPRPVLATTCDYDPKTHHLRRLTGQIRPVDLPDFLTFVRNFRAAQATNCSGGSAVAAISIQILLEDKTARSLTFLSSARCITLFNGGIDTVVPITSLSGSWSQVIDPALPIAAESTAPNNEPLVITPTATHT